MASERESVLSARDMQEAVALGIAMSAWNLERGTGLIPQEVFDDLYANGLLRVGFDQMGEGYPIVTDAGERRFAEILGGDVGDI